jgi:hypothetical protein
MNMDGDRFCRFYISRAYRCFLIKPGLLSLSVYKPFLLEGINSRSGWESTLNSEFAVVAW